MAARQSARIQRPHSPADSSSGSHHQPFRGNGIVRLQSVIGNQAVQRLLRAPEQIQRKPFSSEEFQWIGDVWNMPEIEMLFQAYDEVPDPVLHRVAAAGDAEGVTSGGDISIADRAYNIRSTYLDDEGKPVKAPDEAEFKSTLFHELFHFFFNHTETINHDEVVTPKTMQERIIRPHNYGMSPFKFGWFQHPTSDLILHFDVAATTWQNSPDFYVDPESPLGKFKASGAYEHSPMPQSGDDISPEEDLAETMSLYLTSPESRNLLMAKFPLRYKLISGYFERILPGMVKAKQKAGME